MNLPNELRISIQTHIRHDSQNRMIVLGGIEVDAIELALAVRDPERRAEIHTAMHDALKMQIRCGERALERLQRKEAQEAEGDKANAEVDNPDAE